MTNEEIKRNTEPVKLEDNVYRDPVYYYSREHRLGRASQMVKELNDGKPLKPGLSKTLFATKGHTILFITILLLCAMLYLTSRFTSSESGVRGVEIGGNTLALTIMRNEGVLMFGIVKNSGESGEFYTGPLDIAVSPEMSSPKEGEPPVIPPVFSRRVYLNSDRVQAMQFSLPFEHDDFVVVLQTENEQKTLKLKPEGN